MTPFEAIILGIVQGATEFLPVSSSGHLIIARSILNLPLEYSLSFDAILQFANVIALVIYFWKDIFKIFVTIVRSVFGIYVNKEDKILAWSVVLGTIPAVIIGLVIESYMDTIFRDVFLVAVSLVIGSFVMFFAQKLGKQDKPLSLGRGLVIGLFQSLALIPGISRSGATISGGLLAGLPKNEAVRYSFVLSIPILLGSGAKKLLEIDVLNTSFGIDLLIGSLTSFFVGLLVIHYFIKYMKNHNLNIFIFYRIALAIILIIALF